jgi:hypothetical protein
MAPGKSALVRARAKRKEKRRKEARRAEIVAQEMDKVEAGKQTLQQAQLQIVERCAAEGLDGREEEGKES